MKPCNFEEIKSGENAIAMIVYAGYSSQNIEFFTPPEFSQQLAYMNRPKGYEVAAHIHNKVERKVHRTLEVLFMKSGKARLDLYSDNREYITSRILESGDVVLLASGGHGLVMLENSEIIEVKQGPHAGEADKTRFEGICPDKILVNA